MLTALAILILGSASLGAAADEPVRACIASSRDFDNVHLDKNLFFSNEDFKDVVIRHGDMFQVQRAIGEPQWRKNAPGNVVRGKWVHGERRGAEDKLCDGSSRVTYLTVFFVLDMSFKNGRMRKCAIREDSFITSEIINWSKKELPIIRKNYECVEYFDLLEKERSARRHR